MTIEICSHHFWGAIWAILNIFLIFLIISSGFVMALHDWKYPPSMSNNINDLDWQNAYVTFCSVFVFLSIINGIGFYLANERYHWFALKDCERK